jgi:hypothetical protein
MTESPIDLSVISKLIAEEDIIHEEDETEVPEETDKSGGPSGPTPIQIT